jgi:phage gp36-like protein
MPFKDKNERREYDRKRRKKARAERRRRIDAPCTGQPVQPLEAVPFATAQHAVEIIREQVNLVRADRAGVQTRARTIAYLLSVGLKAVEVADVAERVAALEARLDNPIRPRIVA